MSLVMRLLMVLFVAIQLCTSQTVYGSTDKISVTVEVLEHVSDIHEARQVEGQMSGEEVVSFKQGSWLRVRIDSNGYGVTEQNQLVIKRRGAWRLFVYQAPDYERQEFSNMRPNGYIFYPYFMPVSLSLQSLQGEPLYIETDLGNVDNLLFVASESDLLKENQFYLILTAATRAVILFVLLLALSLWLKLRAKVYLIYAGYVSTHFFAISIQDGSFFFLWLPEYLREHGNELYAYLAIVSYILAVSFIIEFLNLNKRLKISAQFLKLSQFIVGAILLAPLFGSSVYALRGAVNIGILLGAVSIICTTCYMVIFDRDRRVIYALTGWSIYFSAIVLLVLSGLGITKDQYVDFTYFQIATMLELVIFQTGLAEVALSYRKQRDNAMFLATQDSLTGAYNRHGLHKLLPNLIERSKENQTPLAVAMLDIDHFKQVNDTYGHDAGDMCLQNVARIIMQHLRKDDLLVRFGGEEFVVLLSDSNAEQAARASERIRLAVENESILISHPPAEQSIKVTLSIGVSTYALDKGFEYALKLADNALYRSKQAGRNCVTAATT